MADISNPSRKLKIIFWLLLIANLLFFIIMTFGRSLLEDPNRPDPNLMTLHADQIRIVPIGSPVAASAPEPTATAESAVPESTIAAASATSEIATSAPAAASAPVVTAVAATPTTETTAPLVCLEWSKLAEHEVRQSQKLLAQLKLGDKVMAEQDSPSKGYWVYIPPQPDSKAINKKIAELKAQNISQYFVVREEGARHNAVSLGVFKTKEPAQRLLNELKGKSISDATLGEYEGKARITKLRLNDLDSTQIQQIKTFRKQFPSSELKNIRCKS